MSDGQPRVLATLIDMSVLMNIRKKDGIADRASNIELDCRKSRGSFTEILVEIGDQRDYALVGLAGQTIMMKTILLPCSSVPHSSRQCANNLVTAAFLHFWLDEYTPIETNLCRDDPRSASSIRQMIRPGPAMTPSMLQCMIVPC